MSIQEQEDRRWEYGVAPADLDGRERKTFVADVAQRGALFALVEGIPDGERAPLFEGIRTALEIDRGTPSSRLLRAVGVSCRRLEARTLHRFELAGLGLTALLIEEGAVYLTQLLPSQAYVIQDGVVRSVPETPMRGASRIGSTSGRRWEVEIDTSRFAARPGSAYVLCTAGLVERLTPAKLFEAARQPATTAAAALHATTAKASIGGEEEILVVQTVASTDGSARARIFPIRERRAGNRGEPAPPPRVGTAKLASWGLQGQPRPTLRHRLGDPLPAVGRPRRRSALWLVAPALAATAGAVAAGRFILQRSDAARPDAASGQSALASPSPTPAAPAAAGGPTLLASTDPFTSLAVANGAPRVLDAASRIAQPGTPPATLAGAGQILALAVRDAETLALDGGRTLWRLGEGAEPARPLALRAASLWQRPQAIAVYAGNLYVLDAGSPGSGGQIWRHTGGSAGGFDGDAQAWLIPNSGVSLDGATSMAIDGSIWVSRADGTVLRLTAGRPEPFQLSGVEGPVRNVGALYTDRAIASVYVLDAAARRLLKLAKTGQLEAEVPNVFPVGEHARGLWVDETGRRALLLTDRRLQEVTLV